PPLGKGTTLPFFKPALRGTPGPASWTTASIPRFRRASERSHPRRPLSAGDIRRLFLPTRSPHLAVDEDRNVSKPRMRGYDTFGPLLLAVHESRPSGLGATGDRPQSIPALHQVPGNDRRRIAPQRISLPQWCPLRRLPGSAVLRPHRCRGQGWPPNPNT